MSEKPKESQYFRASIGIAIVNDEGLVLALERAEKKESEDGTLEYVGTDQWQMAQGGLDVNEDEDEEKELEHGAFRELKEELALEAGDVCFMFEHPEWLAYELPAEDRTPKHGRGQVQKWFFYRLAVSDSEIDLVGHGAEQEFIRFEWMDLSELAEKTWSVRRPIYERLAEKLARELEYKK